MLFRHLSISNCLDSKMWELQVRTQYPGSHSVWVPAVSKNFPDRPRITGSLLQRKLDGTDIWMFVCFSLWVWVPSLWWHSQGKLLLKNDLRASIFKQCVTLSTQNAGKVMLLWWTKGIKKACFLGIYLSASLDSKIWELQVCTEALISRVIASMFPCTFWALWTHS